MWYDIDFANPEYFWLLLLLPVVIIWHYFTGKKIQARLKITSLNALENKTSFNLNGNPIELSIQVKV